MKRSNLSVQFFAAAMLLSLLHSPASAIHLVVDYSFDSNNFFGAGNPQGITAGMQAKAALEAAASYFSDILNDTFSPIVTPPAFRSGVFNGQVIWQWSETFTHPGNGSDIVLANPIVAADEYRIYAGARSLPGTTSGIGGPGGFGWSSSPSGGFTFPEIDQINAITSAFAKQVEHREETSGFASWGGAISFDRDGSTAWHYDHTTPPASFTTDFYSTAIHQLTHALGFSTSDEFNALVSGTNFIGSNATITFGGPVPLTADRHWAAGTSSTVYGSATPQEAAMDPDLLHGTRKFLTNLDGAALKDIGWELIAPNVPEPATVSFCTFATVALGMRRRPLSSRY